MLVSAIAPFFGVDEPLKVTHLLFVNLVMDGLGAMMLGNEPALPEYMDEAPRKRTDPLVSRSMMYQIGIMGIWLTVLSLFYLTSDWTRSFFETDKQFLTSYFVLFIASALFNGFNVRDDGFRIFGHLKEDPVYSVCHYQCILTAGQSVYIYQCNVQLCSFWRSRLASGLLYGLHHDPGRYDPEGSYADIL